MAHVITDLCIECGRCVPVCPEKAIAKVDGHHVIDPAGCTDVAMCVRYCPVQGAIIKAEQAGGAPAPDQG